LPFQRSNQTTDKSQKKGYREISLPWEIQIPPEGIALVDIERHLINQALERTNGNQTKAAELLMLTRETLKYRMRKFNLH